MASSLLGGGGGGGGGGSHGGMGGGINKNIIIAAVVSYFMVEIQSYPQRMRVSTTTVELLTILELTKYVYVLQQFPGSIYV